MMEIFGFSIGRWEIFGFFGNAIFGVRFLIQWIASERAGKSIVPPAFWYASIAGTLILAIYFIHLRNVVGLLGFTLNMIPYTRNLVLIRREKAGQEDSRTGE